MKQNFLVTKPKLEAQEEKQDNPFTRKSNRTKVVSGATKRRDGDPTSGGDQSGRERAHLVGCIAASNDRQPAEHVANGCRRQRLWDADEQRSNSKRLLDA